MIRKMELCNLTKVGAEASDKECRERGEASGADKGSRLLAAITWRETKKREQAVEAAGTSKQLAVSPPLTGARREGG